MALLQANRVFRGADLDAFGISRFWLHQGLAARMVIKVAPGIYRRSDVTLTLRERLHLVQIELDDPVFAGPTALWMRGVLRAEPEALCVAIGNHARARNLGELRVRYLRTEASAVEEDVLAARVEGFQLRVHLVARAVVDSFKYRKQVGLEVAATAMDAAIADLHVAPSDLVKMAERRRVSRIVRSHVAAWSRRLPFPELEDGDERAYQKWIETGLPPDRVRGRPPVRRDPVPLFALDAFQAGRIPLEIARHLELAPETALMLLKHRLSVAAKSRAGTRRRDR